MVTSFRLISAVRESSRFSSALGDPNSVRQTYNLFAFRNSLEILSKFVWSAWIPGRLKSIIGLMIPKSILIVLNVSDCVALCGSSWSLFITCASKKISRTLLGAIRNSLTIAPNCSLTVVQNAFGFFRLKAFKSKILIQFDRFLILYLILVRAEDATVLLIFQSEHL